MSHTAVLDIGKTNKKCFVFDARHQIVFEKSTTLPETTDEDGDPCEDLPLLRAWALDTLRELLPDPRFSIGAFQCSAYGASFVLLDAAGQACAPLYNYLKPFPEDLQKSFYRRYGGESRMALETASPVLGSLNSGLQLYRLRHEKPALFKHVRHALHLPQYISFLATGRYHSDLTSIGCHTALWHFSKNTYHPWVRAEGIEPLLAPIAASDATFAVTLHGKTLRAGVGLHDSSAALIPYLTRTDEPFVLLSTGTWCISLNPFNAEPLSAEELAQDCLCYLNYRGRPVKAARLFAGHEHEQAVRRLALQHGAAPGFFTNIRFDEYTHHALENGKAPAGLAEAYHAFMAGLVKKQAASTQLAIGQTPVRRLIVEGGFAKNEVYTALLAKAFPGLEVQVSEVAQASALGAALSVGRVGK